MLVDIEVEELLALVKLLVLLGSLELLELNIGSLVVIELEELLELVELLGLLESVELLELDVGSLVEIELKELLELVIEETVVEVEVGEVEDNDADVVVEAVIRAKQVQALDSRAEAATGEGVHLAANAKVEVVVPSVYVLQNEIAARGVCCIARKQSSSKHLSAGNDGTDNTP